MSDRFDAWRDVMAARDAALWSLFVLSAMFAASWHFTRFDGPLNQKVQAFVITGTILVFYGTLAYLLVAGR